MEEMHYFKESQRGEIPVPDFKDNITRKLLLQFLCDLCTWAQATPVTSVGIKKDAHSLYILFRNFTFSEQDFWQTFGGYLIAPPTKMENRYLWHRTFFTGNGSIVAGPAKREILCGSKNDFRPLCGQYPFSLPAN